MPNVLTRTLAGIVYIGLIVGSLLLPLWAFTLLLALFVILGIAETDGICRSMVKKSIGKVWVDTLVALNLVLLVGFYFAGLDVEALLCIMLCLLGVRVIWQIYSPAENAIHSLASSALSVVYIALPLAILYAIYLSISPMVVLTLFILIWVNDTGAYVVGCTMGRHRLFERLSPKKSWEGFWGGLVFSVIAAMIIKYLAPNWLQQLDMLQAAILGLVVSVAATYGDLFESMLKRTGGIKDSGHIIPGHGGILDRIDSLLFVAPVAMLYFFILSFFSY